ncbi:hypothetical protein GCM10011609_27760 [Lentzea pudingi]|uniref:Transport permease protein n=1 Tax=Lentzea pudingi TaxID=1789439 RepID=A0ABQ2HRC1_9PSEU|nr:ABC transporter permease [Lentzea pudingi]GGM89359.1 hypothetical protein GCM10011609_27760 [Lentzea pudingi]
MIALFWASVRFQLQVLRRSPDYLMAVVTIPLLAIAFLAIMKNAGRADLAPYAVLGSTLMTVWATALFVSGELIESERTQGTLEGVLAAPVQYQVLVLGRISIVTVLSFFGLAESIVVAWLVFGYLIAVPHLGLLLLTLLCTAFAMVGTASIMAGLFVLARSARIFQNSLSYPFYVLGGTVVPIALLPGWLQPVSKIVFLSWASDLLRDCLAPTPPRDVLFRLTMILVLGAVAFAIGHLLTKKILRRVRQTGSAGYA